MFKSIKTSVLALILVSTAVIAHAQTAITEGVVVYSATSPQGTADTKVKFNGDISSYEVPAGPATVVIYTDHKNSLGMVTVDVPIQQMQIAAKMTKADFEKARAQYPTYGEFKATGEKQTIAGYNAEKYTTKDSKGADIEVWVTTDIDIPANSFTSAFKAIKGTPVKLAGGEMSFTLKSVKAQKVGELSVTKIPSGYEEITYAEMMAMSGRQ